MKTATITATQYFEHDGQPVRPGDVLDVPPVQAASLKYRGLAKLGGYRTAAVTSEPDAVDAGSPSAEEDTSITTPRRRRTYRRRDLTAEE